MPKYQKTIDDQVVFEKVQVTKQQCLLYCTPQGRLSLIPGIPEKIEAEKVHKIKRIYFNVLILS